MYLNSCVLLLLVDVLSEDSIIKWYIDGHTPKGKSVFLPQMSKMIDWLQNAEEGIAHLLVNFFGK